MGDAEAPTADVFVAREPDAPRERAAAPAGLRDAGIAADTDYAGRSLKGQLTQAGLLRRFDDGDPPSGDALIRRQAAGRTGRPRGRSRQIKPMRPWRTHMAGEPTKDLVGRSSSCRAGPRGAATTAA